MINQSSNQTCRTNWYRNLLSFFLLYRGTFTLAYFFHSQRTMYTNWVTYVDLYNPSFSPCFVQK